MSNFMKSKKPRDTLSTPPPPRGYSDSTNNNSPSQRQTMYSEFRQSSYPSSSQKSKLSIMKLPIAFTPLRGKANKAIKLENHQDALKFLSELIVTYPDNYQARCDRAEIYRHLKKSDDAIKDLNYAIEKKPSKARAFYIRGLIYKEDLKDLVSAQNDLSNALKRDM